MEAKIGKLFDSVKEANIGTYFDSVKETNIGRYFDSVVNFFSGHEQIPWSDPQTIYNLEQEVAEVTQFGSEEQQSKSIRRLYRALVHSTQLADVQRGISMLEASLHGASTSSSVQLREKIYLLAVGYYRSGDFTKSRQLVEQCLKIKADYNAALILKETIENRIAKDGVIGIGIAIAATVAGLIVGGIVTVKGRRNGI